MRCPILAVALPIFAFPACAPLHVAAQAGYAQMSLDGDIGYTSGSGVVVDQDVQSAFGLGDDQGTPYGRAEFDFGVPRLVASGFLFDDEGSGTLQADFGDIPGGVPVNSDFELSNLSGALAFDIGIGPVTISPGIAVDYFDLRMEVTDAFSIQRETVELSGPVPMGFLRGQVEFWKFAAIVEGGYVTAELDDVDATLVDLEAMLEFRPTDLFNLFVGYRELAIDGDGNVDGDDFDVDITLGGFFFGGGVRF
jgi:hypothetical protein